MSEPTHPEVTWAQRFSESDASKNYIYLTIMATDVPEKDLKLDLQPTKLSFKGTSTTKKVTYAVDLEFFGEIDPKESQIRHSSRNIEIVLRKKGEEWPRLLKESKKLHFLRTDWDRLGEWETQDEQGEEDSMANMNPMGGAGGDGGFGGIDFSKLGAAQGAGGMPDLGDMAGMMGGMGGMGGEGGDESSDDEDDDDMPELEDESKTGESSKPKIEEVA